MSPLPQELIEVVIHNLSAKRDRQTLMACALVAKSWVYPSYEVLFRTEIVSDHYELDNFISKLKLPNTLSLSFIRDLQIQVFNLDLHLAMLIHILRQLPQLRSLEFYWTRFTISHATIYPLVDFMASLENVKLFVCTAVTWPVFSRFLQIFSRIGLLHIDSLSIRDPSDSAVPDTSLTIPQKIHVHLRIKLPQYTTLDAFMLYPGEFIARFPTNTFRALEIILPGRIRTGEDVCNFMRALAPNLDDLEVNLESALLGKSFFIFC